MVCEERTEQTAPSFMPVIKLAVGGRVWERSREEVKRAGSGVPPCGVTRIMQDEAHRVLCFRSSSVVTACFDCAMVLWETEIPVTSPELALHQHVKAATGRISRIYHLLAP